MDAYCGVNACMCVCVSVSVFVSVSVWECCPQLVQLGLSDQDQVSVGGGMIRPTVLLLC